MTDVYFLDFDAKSATYGNQSARKQRRMVGGRYFNRLRHPSVTVEVLALLGSARR